MRLILNGHGYIYEIENTVRSFGIKISGILYDGTIKKTGSDSFCYSRLAKISEKSLLLIAVKINGNIRIIKTSLPRDAEKKEIEFSFCEAIFGILAELTGFSPAWGLLTGVRPVKLMLAVRDEVGSFERAEELLKTKYKVSTKKINLLSNVSRFAEGVSKRVDTMSYSLYISIPFCPSRCSYCSFVSKEVERDMGLLEAYIEKLIEEIRLSFKIADDIGLGLFSVYIGGGTPTVLSENLLDRLMEEISFSIPPDLAEFTVEAGRPDTLNRDKLKVLSRYPVNRIAINPQTMNDEVLKNIGRNHTVNDFLKAFTAAREIGFSNINSDVIAGLKGETLEGFERGLNRLIELKPQGITVHALTLKRGSQIREGSNIILNGEAADMVSFATDRLEESGYGPYYLYRQKGTVDGLENTGYSLPGFEGIYNSCIMDEIHTIISCGAGGVTKLKEPYGRKIKRTFNYKYPVEYIDGFEEILKRKGFIKRFYEEAFQS
ncbi:MAG: coproporphyrinogen dehydrogenase HemZ [Ruminococcaceae bacterium]|nr:coproporphyrinogen dehydrogenase HemZ [Oscillospiraceae bacterium]